VPLIGVAIALSSMAEGRYGFVAGILLVAWIGWNYVNLEDYGAEKLTADADSRAYVGQLQASATSIQSIPMFLFHGLPPGFPPWGISGALRYLFPHLNFKIAALEDRPAAQPLLQSPAVATLFWTEANHRLWIAVHEPDTPDATYIIMNELTPVWQLTGGWYGLENDFRWIEPVATARLYRAQRATQFEVVLNVIQQLLETGGHIDCSVRLNGIALGSARITEPGNRTVRFPLPPGPPGAAAVELKIDPPFQGSGQDPRTFGAPVVSFGFLPSGR